MTNHPFLTSRPLAHAIAFAMLVPSIPAAEPATVYGGIGVSATSDDTSVFPILTVETGRFSFGLNETTVAVVDTNAVGLGLGLAYDFDGKVDAIFDVGLFTNAGVDVEARLGTSFVDEGSFASLDISRSFDIGLASLTPSVGIYAADVARREADNDEDDLPGNAWGYVSLTGFVPVSESTAIVATVTASDEPDRPISREPWSAWVTLIHEF